jgi:hypothetical protein
MLITYRRTGGLFALLTIATVVLAATVLTVAVAATVILAAAIAAAAFIGRAMLPRSWRKRMVSSATPWSHETIDATVVNATSSAADTRDLPRMDGSTT